MEKTKMKVEELGDIKKQLMSALKSQMGNLDNLDTKEAGEVVDMIKDLAEAEAYCWKSTYYETVIKAMEESEKEPHYGESRMGYDNWRYSDGRYAPTGHGHMSGYIRDLNDTHPHETWTKPMMDDRYGYPHTAQTGNRVSRYGHTGDMDMQIHEVVGSVKDMYKEATPEHRKELKEKMMKLMDEWKEV